MSETVIPFPGKPRWTHEPPDALEDFLRHDVEVAGMRAERTRGRRTEILTTADREFELEAVLEWAIGGDDEGLRVEAAVLREVREEFRAWLLSQAEEVARPLKYAAEYRLSSRGLDGFLEAAVKTETEYRQRATALRAAERRFADFLRQPPVG